MAALGSHRCASTRSAATSARRCFLRVSQSVARQPRLETGRPQLQTWSTPTSPMRPSSAKERRYRAAASVQATQDEDLTEVELDISVKGMMCEGCTSRVEEVLKKAKGVSNVQVSLEKGLATVDVRVPSQLEAFAMLPQLVQSVRDLGFEAEPHIDGL